MKMNACVKIAKLLRPLGRVSKLSLRNTLIKNSFSLFDNQNSYENTRKSELREKILKLERTESRNRKNSMNE